MTEVLIAGAGPVGLAMAGELARFGVSVRIVEKSAARTDKSKALVLWSRTLELLDRSGAGAPLVAAGIKVHALNIATGTEPIARVTFDHVPTPHPYALMLPQSDTERLLEEHLNGLGVRVERSVELISFTPGQAEVACMLLHPDGREEQLAVPWLVGCDGAHSTVRHTLGLPFAGDTLPSDWILADVHLSGVPHPGEVVVEWHAEGILVFFPIRGARYRIIADLTGTDGAARSTDPTLEEVQQVLQRRGAPGIVASDPVWLATFHINERKVKDYRAGRVFLAGDAAHVHSPAGGQGMNTGIQDACNLAWKLALVQRGIAAEEPLLSTYSMERSAVGEHVLKNAGRLTEAAILRGPVKQFVRNRLASVLLGFGVVRERLAEEAAELAIGYPDSPLTVRVAKPSDGPQAGERAPLRPGETPAGASLPPGANVTPQFVLYAEPGPDAEALIACFPALLEPQLRKPFAEGYLWLVRPDGYVALTAKTDDWAAADTFLQKLSARPANSA